MSDSLGNPLVFALSAGQAGDAPEAESLLQGIEADVVIAEVEELVEVGELEAESVETPAVFVDRIVQCDPIEVRWDG